MQDLTLNYLSADITSTVLSLSGGCALKSPVTAASVVQLLLSRSTFIVHQIVKHLSPSYLLSYGAQETSRSSSQSSSEPINAALL